MELDLSIKQIHEEMAEGRLSAVKIIEFYLNRIKEYDTKLNSIITVNPDAVKEAEKLDTAFKETGLIGPLHGIPFILKDNVLTKDLLTTSGSVHLSNFIPKKDAHLVKLLKEAGAIILAKANLHEFAIGGETNSSMKGQTLNPYDATRTPGGSSGGTAAAIAANLGVVGIGTDTVNSVRSPASSCNLYGLRPTYGLISRGGVVPSSFNQDCVGILAHNADDVLITLNAIKGYDAEDQATEINKEMVKDFNYVDKKTIRLGFLKSFTGDKEVNDPVNEIMVKALDKLKKNGIEIIDIEEKYDAVELQSTLSVDLYEFKEALNKFLSSEDSIEVNTLEEILDMDKIYQGIKASCLKANSLSTSMEEYKETARKRAELGGKVTDLLDKYNLAALIFPHQKRLTVPIGESQLERNGILGSLTGFPAIVVPMGFSKATETAAVGVPSGIEILGRKLSDDYILTIGKTVGDILDERKLPNMSIFEN